MSNYMFITEAKNTKNGSIIAKVISLGELSSGTSSDGQEWKKQTAVLKDSSDSENLILWNHDIGRVEQGHFYKFDKPYWTEYKGAKQLSLGKFCTILECTEAEMLHLGDTKITINPPIFTQGTSTATTTQGYDYQKHNKEIDDQTKKAELLAWAVKLYGPQLPAFFIRTDKVLASLYLIHNRIIDLEGKEPNGATVGMITKLVLDKID